MLSYTGRNVDYKKVHAHKTQDMESLIDSLDLQNGEILADIMGGHGDVTINAINQCAQKGIQIKPILVDKYSSQFPQETFCTTIISDSRKMPIGNECIDKAAIKLGLHEMKQSGKIKTLKEIHRILKKKGKLAIWEIGLKNKKELKFYSKVIQKKDQLAGFDDLVKNRRFCRETELFDVLNKAGFTNVKKRQNTIFEMSTKNWLTTDLGNDSTKLEKWNNYIRENISEELKKELQFKDEGETIQLKFNWPIIVAEK
jgi:ubiquinone/menaquinone biosynthesis C-methylase UbiE